MSKVWGPLHSDDARGKLADSLVFIGWRGIKDVRMYKIPKNPKTTAQIAWRTKFTTSVARYHDLVGTDIQPWRERAAGFPYIGFNLFVDKWLTWLASLKTPVLIRDLQASAGATQVVATIKSTTVGSMKLKMGVTKGVWTNEVSIIGSAAGATGTITGLTSGVNYYLTADMTSASYPGTYGYHKITTT